MQEKVYHTNYKVENEYFWFLARNKIVFNVIEQNLKLGDDDYVIDIGCGTGGFAKLLDKKFNTVCLDTSEIALDYCKKRGLNNLHKGTLESFPKDAWVINSAVMLDVIEHIEDDAAVVKQVYEMLPIGGKLIASVPAYQWLWSHHDKMHMHYRRYNKKIFIKLLIDAGFKIEYSTYFNTFLFPLAMVKRLIDKLLNKNHSESAVDEVSNFVNNIFTKVFAAESLFIPKIKFPFGMSILTVAKK